MSESMTQSQLRASSPGNFSTLGQLRQIEPDYEDELQRLKSQSEETKRIKNQLARKLEDAKKNGYEISEKEQPEIQRDANTVIDEIKDAIDLIKGKSDFSKFSDDDLQLTYDKLQSEVSDTKSPDDKQLRTIYQIYNEIINRSKSKKD